MAAGLLVAAALLTAIPDPGAAPALHAQVSPIVPAPLDALEGEPLATARTTLDRTGRVIVRTRVNGTEDLRFFVDTGANVSALSEGLARRLGLQPGEDLVVQGVLGSVTAGSVLVEEIAFGNVRWRDKRAPVLGADALGRADGLLGMDGVAGRRIDVDFKSGEVRITRSLARTPKGRFSAPLDLRFGRLAVTPGRIGGLKVPVIIDTGAERSLINASLAAALAAQGTPLERLSQVQVHGVGRPRGQPGDLAALPTVTLAGVDVRNVVPVVGDFHVFDLWGLGQTPALVLGMDVIGRFEAMAIDFPARRFEMRLPDEERPDPRG